MQEVKSIDVMSLAKIKAVFGIIIGLVYGIMAAFIFGAMGMSRGVTGLEVFGVLSIVIFPIVFAIMAFVIGAIVAVLYNVIAGWVGGIRVDLVQK
jgi:hypothetical protein